jgi:CelD/BcsL family acetyltransferase involved in cellulose biosynthesis
MGALTLDRGAVAVACVPLNDALRELPSEWEGLRERSDASPFAGWAWHRAWSSSAPEAELRACHTVVLRSGGRVEAILPLASRSVAFRRQRATALTWAIGDLGCPDHLDVLALPEANFDAFVPALRALPWDILILGNLAASAPHAMRLAQALARHGCAVRWNELWPCPYLDLPATWDEYLATLSPNRRQVLRRRERVLDREHTVTVTDYEGGRLDEGWRHLVALHEQRWAAAGIFNDARVERLHHAFTHDLAQRGQLWLTTLDLDGRPAAAWYGFADRETVYFYQSGRDPRWDDKSVGVALMVKMIRRAIERGYKRFDFLRGDEAYKRQWTVAEEVTRELVAFRPSWRGQWLRSIDLAARLRARLGGSART